MGFGVLGPFYFNDMFEKLNLAGACGLKAGFVLIFGGFAAALVHILGIRLKSRIRNLIKE